MVHVLRWPQPQDCFELLLPFTKHDVILAQTQWLIHPDVTGALTFLKSLQIKLGGTVQILFSRARISSCSEKRIWDICLFQNPSSDKCLKQNPRSTACLPNPTIINWASPKSLGITVILISNHSNTSWCTCCKNLVVPTE